MQSAEATFHRRTIGEPALLTVIAKPDDGHAEVSDWVSAPGH